MTYLELRHEITKIALDFQIRNVELSVCSMLTDTFPLFIVTHYTDWSEEFSITAREEQSLISKFYDYAHKISKYGIAPQERK